MSVRSALVLVLAVISIPAGLVALPIHANSDLPFNWIRNLNSTAWGYTEVEDPSESGSDGVVEKFELRMGDCYRNERENDCNSNRERIELVELGRPVMPLNGEVWYRWKMFFPEDYRIIYPAKTYHVRFLEKSGKMVWSFEIGSTGVLWLGNYVSDEVTYYPLIDEDDLLSQWHEFGVHSKWGSGSAFFKVWVNNVKKVDYAGTTCRGCRVGLGYGIMRSGLDQYYESYPGYDLPTQTIYYSGFERSANGIGYPGYVPPRKIDPSAINNPPQTLKPKLIIELQRYGGNEAIHNRDID